MICVIIAYVAVPIYAMILKLYLRFGYIFSQISISDMYVKDLLKELNERLKLSEKKSTIVQFLF